jgi:plastocyanin
VRRAALIALAAAMLAPAVAGPEAKARGHAPARLLVEAREFNLALSRPSVRAGTAIVQLANRGEDPHDLRLARIGGSGTGQIAQTLPGDVGEWDGRLRRGRYRVYCTLPGHRAAGMRAVLRVR